MPSPGARSSLEERISSYETNIEAAIPYLTSREITRDTAARFRLGYDPATNRLTIPYLTPAGAWHVKRRCITDHDHKTVSCPKYVYDPGADHHLFNAQTLLKAEYVVLVEGEIDAITCEQHGIPAVAYPGVQAWPKHQHWRWCFDSCDEVVVVADADEPGRKAAGAVAQSLRQSINGDVRVVEIPGNNGEDANSFITEFGETEFLQLLEWI